MATRDTRTLYSDELTPEESRYILEGLVKDKRVSKIELRQYRQRMKQEAEELLERLKSLGWGGAAAVAGGVATAVVASSPRGRAAVKRAARAVTPAILAGRKLQGQYLGLIRQIPESQRGRYSAMAKTDGRQAAIDAMRQTLGKTDTNAGGAKKGRKRRARKTR